LALKDISNDAFFFLFPITYSNWLCFFCTPEPYINILGAIHHRLSQIVKDLLLLCRMDQQALSVQRQPCCLNDLISDLVEEFEELASAANVKLTSDVRVHQPLYVTGDVEQLYRLVSNLIANAIQYTPAGGLVSVILDSSKDHALIQIQDTGIGIAPEEQTQIFARFYRVNSDRSRRSGGSGLGLAIVQAHHGSIQVQSELGLGSTFTFDCL
jgi:signal transduction histidine kinase